MPETNVVHVGGRAFDAAERELLERSDVALVSAAAVRTNGIREVLEPVCGALEVSVRSVYLHIDMDVLDPEEARANHLAPADGLTVVQAEDAIRLIRERFEICGAGITAYDPSYDDGGRTASAGIRLVEALILEGGE